MFGSTVLVSRFFVGQLSPLNYVGLRISIGALPFFIFFLLRYRRRLKSVDRRLWKQGLIIGILYDALPFTLFVNALQYLSAGVAAILFSLYPVCVVFMAHFLLPEEPLTRRKTFGVVIALGGAVLITALGESGLHDVGHANPLGYVLMIACVITSAVSTIYMRKQLIHFDVLDVTSVRLFFAALIMMPLSIAIEGLDLSRVTRTGYAVFSIGIAFDLISMPLNFYIIKRFGASTSSTADYITLIVATLGGVLLLGEQITWGIAAGMALIVSGIIMINRAPLLEIKKVQVM